MVTALPLDGYLAELHASLKSNFAGEVATYIPELGRADPAAFEICIATVDGTVYATSDSRQSFTIQSMSKPFSYGFALTAHGRERVLKQVGVEPTGEAFNSIILDDVHNRPFNPMVNAGAIAVAELVPGDGPAEREAALLGHFARLTGRTMEIDASVYESEKATGHRNRAIAWMMLNSGMIAEDPEAVLDLYFKQCSILVTCEDMARMGATLANNGVNPFTGDTVYPPEVVRDVLTLMSTCGMYNFAGQWAYEVGMPAKSGVSGGIVAVIPGQIGIAIYSPPLDPHGNSIRGVEVCRRISQDFGLHAFSGRTHVQSVVRREFRANVVGSKRIRSSGDRALLTRNGAAIAAIEAQGALYFGSAEVLSRRIAALAADARFLAIDLRRAYDADDAALRLLTSAIRQAVVSGVKVAISGFRPGGPQPKLAAWLPLDPVTAGVQVFDELDVALQSFEDALLSEHPHRRGETKYALAELDILRGLSPEDLKALERSVTSFRFEAGQTVIREGDEAKLLFIIAKGTASVSVRTADGGGRRIGSVGPGQCFGEMALLDGGRRSADVTADEPLLCYGLAVEAIRDISVDRPVILSTILGNLVRSLSERLRFATAEIRALE